MRQDDLAREMLERVDLCPYVGFHHSSDVQIYMQSNIRVLLVEGASCLELQRNISLHQC